ncbi:MAG: hypothetical protein B7Y83_05180 [Flavobacteriales bacterium 32-34-25]|nr:MAG: hypothetical protein B7Y83_05180 [Flavobacteriales bacterium 32-34-25]
MYLSVVYFITGLLGFLTFTVVITQYNSNKKVNIYLLVLLFFASSRFLFSAVNILNPFVVNENLMIVFRSFGGVVFPCFYLYFKSLVTNKKNVTKDDLKYFAIPVLFGFTNLLILEYASFLHIYVYFLFSAIALYYVFLSYVELKNKLWFRKSKVAIIDKQKVLLRNFTIFFFVICALTILRLVVSLFLDIYVAGYSDGTNYLWIAAIFNCVLYFKILLTPSVLHNSLISSDEGNKKEYFELVFEDFWNLTDAVLVSNSQDLRLKERVDNNLLTYVHEVERMALEQFCFRNPSVSMRDFAIKLGIPKSHLLYLFKYHSNVSFIEFKKTVRIYDAISLIEAGYLKSNTLMSLSKKTGFSSYSSFLLNFKEITGVIPQEYNKMIRE